MGLVLTLNRSEEPVHITDNESNLIKGSVPEEDLEESMSATSVALFASVPIIVLIVACIGVYLKTSGKKEVEKPEEQVIDDRPINGTLPSKLIPHWYSLEVRVSMQSMNAASF